MFKATDFKLIRRNCPEELDKLLKLLGISTQNFDTDDELNEAIDQAFCTYLNCKSDLDGYGKLLDLGGIKFDSGETRREMLKKILDNRKRIFQSPSAAPQAEFVTVTCHYAEPIFDVRDKSFAASIKEAVNKILDALRNKDISRLLPLKEKFTLKRSAENAIKNIIAKECDLADGDEIVISIIRKDSVSTKRDSVLSVSKPDSHALKILEQIDRIFDKI